jgi:Big-like domain-containing protein
MTLLHRRMAVLACVTLCVLLLATCSSGNEPSEPGLVLLSIGPSAILPGAGPLFLTAHGTGFQDGAVVERDGTALQTTFTSDSRIGAEISRQDVEIPDTSTIQVRNPDGELSNGVSFVISSDADPFHIDSTAPASQAEVNADTSIAIYLSDALDSASVVDTGLVVRDETGDEVSGTISYDRDARALRWSGALSELHRYTVSLSDELRTPAGGAIGGALTWSFTTTLGVTAPLDSSGAWPSMILGVNGSASVVYRSPSKVRLATCAAGCGARALWSITNVGQLGGPDYLSVAIDGTGKLHFGFQDPAGLSATYATATGQTAGIEGDAAYTDIGASASGRLHLLYYQNGDLHAATCAITCATSANWQVSEVDADGNAGSFPSVVVDPQGGVHVTYFENDSGDLRYAVCATPCTTPSWIAGPVDTVGRVGFGSSLVIDGTGRLHASWIDLDAGDVVYGTCLSACTTVNGWSRAIVDHIAGPAFSFGWDYTSLALGPNGLELSYYDVLAGRLRGASCSSDCSAPGAWTTFTVSLHGTSEPGFRMLSLRVDGGGQRHVAWIDGSGAVRYTRY